MRMNTFRNDGNFLAKFKAMQRKEAPSAPATAIEQNEKSDHTALPNIPIPSGTPSSRIAKMNNSVAFANDGGFLSRFKQLKNVSTGNNSNTVSGCGKNDPIKNLQNASTSLTVSHIKAAGAHVSDKRQHVPPAEGASTKPPVFSSGADDGSEYLDLEPKTLEAIRNLADEVLKKGFVAEEEVRLKHIKDSTYWFLRDRESAAYKYYQRMIQPAKAEKETPRTESTTSLYSDDVTASATRRKRKSRWDTDERGAKQVAVSSIPLPAVVPIGCLASTAGPSGLGQKYEAPEFDSLVGSSEEESRKQMLEQAQLRLIHEKILAKRAAMKAREQAILMGKAKPVFEYDSDEEAEEGTWEHKLRKMEMEKTKDEAEKLNDQSHGKHHIGQFLPPEELAKFVTACDAAQTGKPLDKSDHQEAKLTEENKGFKLLQKMGWTEGKGLGAAEQGITAPINKGRALADNEGLGASTSNDVSGMDDAYDTYRKRMMLAYRFRPNPLNNPRRPYY